MHRHARRKPALILLALTLLAACQREPSPAAPAWQVYVSNERSGDLSVIDPATRAEIARIPIGKRPRGLIASPDGRWLYVALSGSPIGGPGVDEDKLPPADKAADGIAVIDLATRRIVRTLKGISDPETVAVSPNGRRLYVASEDSGRMLAIDPADGRIAATLDVGGEPEGITVSPDGGTVLVTSEVDHAVAVIATAPSPHVVRRIPVGERPRNALYLKDGTVLVPGELDATLTRIDPARGSVLGTIALAKADRPMGMALAPGGAVYVTTGRGGRLLKVDPAKGVTAAVAVGARPWGLALSPDGATAFTANGPGNDVAVVDTATMRVTGRIATRGGPWGVVVVRAPR